MQSSLDSWLEDVEKLDGEKVEEKRQVVSPSDRIENICSYYSLQTRLHAGSIYILYHTDEIRVYADCDHVFHECPIDCLITTIRRLHEIVEVLRKKGVDVHAIAKAYDDDLYPYISQPDHVEKAKQLLSNIGFRVYAFPYTSNELQDLERRISSYMERIPSEIVEKSLQTGHM